MKLLKATLAATLVASAFTTATLPLTSHAETEADTTVKTKTMYTNHGVNVRTSPSASSKILGVLPKNEKIQVTKKYNKYWYEIIYNDKKAYVSVDYVSAKPLVVLPKVVEKGYVQNTNGVSLNVRAKASSTGKIIGSIKPGGTVSLTKKYSTATKKASWYEVVYNNQVGYVSSKYIGFTKPASPKVVKNGVVHDVTLNVRAGASNTSKVIGKLEPKTVVTFAKKYTTDSTDAWLKIEYKDGTGYISKKYVDFVLPSK